MENNKNKRSVKFQGDMLNFCDFIQVFVFTPNHHLNRNAYFTLTSVFNKCTLCTHLNFSNDKLLVLVQSACVVEGSLIPGDGPLVELVFTHHVYGLHTEKRR